MGCPEGRKFFMLKFGMPIELHINLGIRYYKYILVIYAECTGNQPNPGDAANLEC